MGIISLILIHSRMKKEWAEAKGESFDWTGSVIYGLAMAALIFGFSKLPSLQGWVITGAGLMLMPLFVLREQRAVHPLFDITLISRNRVFAFSSLAALIHYAATSAIGFFLSLFLQYIKDLGPRDAGFVLMSWPVTMALISPLAGKLSDHHNPGVLASIGMAISAAGLVMLCFLTQQTSVAFIVVSSADHGSRIFSLLFSKFKCNNELRGEAPAGKCLRHARHDEKRGSDLQHGNCTDAARSLHGTRKNQPGQLSAADEFNEKRIHRFLNSLLRRNIRLTGKK